MSDTIYVECLGFVFNKDAAININTECGLLTNSELNEILTEEEKLEKDRNATEGMRPDGYHKDDMLYPLP